MMSCKPNDDIPAHHNKPYTSIILVNLGTPDEPTPKAVRRYLKEFLSDPRVVELPKCLWWLILNGIILNVRPRQSAKAYQQIWTKEGSPLRTITQQQTHALSNLLKTKTSTSIVVHFAMRYGQPSIASVLDEVQSPNLKKLIVLPLFPQYSSATAGSVFVEVTRQMQKWRYLPEFHFIHQYADHPDYVSAIANRIQTHWQQEGRAERLLFSYHGLPEKNLHAGDPYYCFCQKTSRLVAEKLQLSKKEYRVCFQSRFGYAKWLQPYTDETLVELSKQDIKTVDLICPGFSADCLETLEENAMRNREIFLNEGGRALNYIPALNADLNHIHMLATLVRPYVYSH